MPFPPHSQNSVNCPFTPTVSLLQCVHIAHRQAGATLLAERASLAYEVFDPPDDDFASVTETEVSTSQSSGLSDREDEEDRKPVEDAGVCVPALTSSNTAGFAGVDKAGRGGTARTVSSAVNSSPAVAAPSKPHRRLNRSKTICMIEKNRIIFRFAAGLLRLLESCPATAEPTPRSLQEEAIIEEDEEDLEAVEEEEQAEEAVILAEKQTTSFKKADEVQTEREKNAAAPPKAAHASTALEAVPESAALNTVRERAANCGGPGSEAPLDRVTQTQEAEECSIRQEAGESGVPQRTDNPAKMSEEEESEVEFAGQPEVLREASETMKHKALSPDYRGVTQKQPELGGWEEQQTGSHFEENSMKAHSSAEEHDTGRDECPGEKVDTVFRPMKTGRENTGEYDNQIPHPLRLRCCFSSGEIVDPRVDARSFTSLHKINSPSERETHEEEKKRNPDTEVKQLFNENSVSHAKQPARLHSRRESKEDQTKQESRKTEREPPAEKNSDVPAITASPARVSRSALLGKKLEAAAERSRRDRYWEDDQTLSMVCPKTRRGTKAGTEGTRQGQLSKETDKYKTDDYGNQDTESEEDLRFHKEVTLLLLPTGVRDSCPHAEEEHKRCLTRDEEDGRKSRDKEIQSETHVDASREATQGGARRDCAEELHIHLDRLARNSNRRAARKSKKDFCSFSAYFTSSVPRSCYSLPEIPMPVRPVNNGAGVDTAASKENTVISFLAVEDNQEI